MSDTAPIEHPTRLTAGDFTASDEPAAAVRPVAGGGHPERADRPERHGARHRRPDGLPNVRMVLLKGFDERGLRLLHQHGQPEGPGARLATPKAALLFHWKSLRPAGPPARPGRAGVGRRGRRLFRDAARGWRRSAPGRASSRRRSRAGSRSKRRSRATPPSTRSARVPRPPHWSGYRLVSAERSSSGRTGRSACTTASSSAASCAGAPWSKTRLYP